MNTFMLMIKHCGFCKRYSFSMILSILESIQGSIFEMNTFALKPKFCPKGPSERTISNRPDEKRRGWVRSTLLSHETTDAHMSELCEWLKRWRFRHLRHVWHDMRQRTEAFEKGIGSNVQFERINLKLHIKENVLAIFMTTFHPNDPGIHPNDRGIHENFDYGVNLLWYFLKVTHLRWS